MKILFENYKFNAATKQITFNTTDVIDLYDLLIITNVTTNTIIYNFADPAKGGTISNNVLTLTFNTTGMSNSDRLQIFLDNAYTPTTEESIQYLKKIVQLLTPISVQDSAQRQRITLDAATTTAAVTVAQTTAANLNATVTGTVTAAQATATNLQVTANQATAANLNANIGNISGYGGVDPRFQFIDAARLTYARGIRVNLQFT